MEKELPLVGYILSYLCLSFNPFDKCAIIRVINFPERGITNEHIRKLEMYSDRECSFLESLQRANQAGLDSDAVTAVKAFDEFLDKICSIYYKTASDVVEFLVKELHISRKEWDEFNEKHGLNSKMPVEEYICEGIEKFMTINFFEHGK